MTSTATVNRLITVALDAMEAADEDFSELELLSACFTLALRTAQAAIQRDPASRPTVAKAAEMLLLQCADERRIH